MYIYVHPYVVDMNINAAFYHSQDRAMVCISFAGYS